MTGPPGGPYGGEPPDSPWRRPQPGEAVDGPPGLGGGQPSYQPGQVPDRPGQPPYRPGQVPHQPGQPSHQPDQPRPGLHQPGPHQSGRPPHQPGQAPYRPGPGYASTPAGFPPPPGAGAADPQRSGRRVLALVGGLAVVAVALAGVLVFVLFRGDPRGTADQFMAALRAKDVDKAHSVLCKDGQQRLSKEELRRSFDLDSRTITGYVLGAERQREREGEDETLVPVTITYDQGAQVELQLGVWDQGAGQKVCSLNPPG